ncbi:calmodulin-binding protein 60 A-like isoform X2 [Phragmites australis]|uniref:calmodulin-binding protein 60 A-like isoform X2 n=1 Tax=Phragmites australis TaxID=29695 RepID=UPI002D768EEE|nr:calmodulin-binding protein 60 A-like isoform X2 [Phragmites australis]
MPAKRRREGGGGGGDGGVGGGDGGGRYKMPAAAPASPVPALKRRCRSFDLEIRGCRHLQELTTRVEAIETAVSRIPEELRKVLTSYFNHIPVPRIEQNLPPIYKLSFVNSLSDEIYTKRKVRAAGGDLIKIRVSVSNQQGSDSPHLLSAKVKIVVLDGDFNADNHDGWTPEEFSNHIVRPRDKVGVVLTGDTELNLRNGEAYLENATFVDNSRFTRSGKFRLAVSLIDDLGVRVQEGITEPFIVKDRRGEGSKKRDIPRLDDEVFRLKKISMNGVYHKALKQSGIPTVKHFLRLYHKDANALRNVLSNASQLVWTTIVDHAKMCDPGRSLYSHFIKDKDIRLYFSSTGQIVGATKADQYNAFGDLDTPQKALLEEWSKDAYESMTYHQPDYEMYNSQPRPINQSILQGLIMAGPKSTEPTDKITHEADKQDILKDNELSGCHSQQCTIRRLGSVRVRPLPSAHENNDVIDATFDIDIQLCSDFEIQYEAPDANCITGSVTVPCPTIAANETIGSVELDRVALTMDQGSYHVPFTNDDSSLFQCFPEQQVASQCASPLFLSIQADRPVLSTQNSFVDSQIYEILKNSEQNELLQDYLGDDFPQLSALNVSKSRKPII